ncbi:hypothetical protein N9Z14_00285 [Opitutales bacterium]|nr:hypothetical protein [Opitutales bacterium]
MKKLSPKDVIISEFSLMSSRSSPRQLFRLNTDKYVIVFLEHGTTTFHFEAPILSEVLEDLGGGIRDVTLIEPKNLEHSGYSHHPHFEIRLHLNRCEIVAINSQDKVHLILPAAYGYMTDETEVKPVCEVWALPDVYPFSHLQISGGLVKLIDPLVADETPETVLCELWTAYQAVTNDRSIKPPIPHFTLVSGPHFQFTVTEHPCGRVTLSL